MHNQDQTSLFIKSGGYWVGTIKLDLLLDESHSLESEVTQHPVEDGSQINDHIHIKPRRGSLTGFVTNAPMVVGYNGGLPKRLAAKLSQMQKQGGINGFLEDVGSNVATTPRTALSAAGLYSPTRITPDDLYSEVSVRPNRVQSTWDAFKALQLAREPVVIVTGLEKYRDVVITKVETTRDKETGDAGRFKVEFQEIQIVTLSEIGIGSTQRPNFKTAEGKQAGAKAKKGKTGGASTRVEDRFKEIESGKLGKQLGTKKAVMVNGKLVIQ